MFCTCRDVGTALGRTSGRRLGTFEQCSSVSVVWELWTEKWAYFQIECLSESRYGCDTAWVASDVTTGIPVIALVIGFFTLNG